MGATYGLTVPDEHETAETGRQFFAYHIANSRHDDSLTDLFEYERFQERFTETGEFSICKKPTNTVVEAGEPSMQQIQWDYEDADHVVRASEGLELFVDSLEAARENLTAAGTLSDGQDRAIEMCINMIEFANENGYGITF